jgi:DNA-binding transcriptional regulator YiaG
MAKKKIEKASRFAGLLQEAKDWKSGKTKWKTTLVENDGTRTILEESFPESMERQSKSVRLKSCRGELDLSQYQMASLLHAPVRTLQGWEAGRPIPDAHLHLAEIFCQVKRSVGAKDLKDLQVKLMEMVEAARTSRGNKINEATSHKHHMA